jgi:hypothetical protein
MEQLCRAAAGMCYKKSNARYTSLAARLLWRFEDAAIAACYCVC